MLKRTANSSLATWIVGIGLGFVGLGLFSMPATTRADEGTGPACNEGGDPSMPLGCYGWCYWPKICTVHPIRPVCACR